MPKIIRVVALVPERDYASLEDIFKFAAGRGEKPFIVVLDHINDPQNLGAIIRSAECAGAHGVVIPKRNAATLNAAASKAAAGADAHIPVCKVVNIASAIDDLKERGVWVYCAEAGENSIYNTDLTGSIAIVMGNEGTGGKPALGKTTLLYPSNGRINSLNVSSAAAVILLKRQNKETADWSVWQLYQNSIFPIY